MRGPGEIHSLELIILSHSLSRVDKSWPGLELLRGPGFLPFSRVDKPLPFSSLEFSSLKLMYLSFLSLS